jgi:hypothetical protein
VPRHRFDSAAGLHRVRYAATTAHGAARERYRDTGMLVPSDHAEHHIAALSGELTVLDLRREAVLDALTLDDRISTAREPTVWESAQELTDRAARWWGPDVHALVYRPRTTPETSANVALYRHASLDCTSAPFHACTDLLDELRLRGFTIDW